VVRKRRIGGFVEDVFASTGREAEDPDEPA
jgi:hypothetical protein